MPASLHADFVKAIAHLAKARKAFKGLVESNLILGNDNHIGDVGEYWVRRYYELKGQFECYGPGKNGPFDIRLKNGKCVSVGTPTASSWTRWKPMQELMLASRLLRLIEGRPVPGTKTKPRKR